jgi:DNA helicase-2/ATP-dependent DNA helicase PcrA
MILNHQQQRVVDHPGGPLLVLACPGSGKTRCITERITRLLDEEIKPANILGVTFTNKAAKEMAERVRERGYGHKLLISTFHSLCVKILRKCGHLEGYKRNFSICDDAAQKNLLSKIVKGNGWDPKKAKYDPRKLAGISDGKKHMYLSDDEFEFGLDSDYVKIFREYQKTLKLSNSMDFGDLIYNVVKIFESNPKVKNAYAIKFKHVLVDEMQDTNKVQLRLVRHLASYHKNVIAVGDADQSIYGWRGACIDNIMKFTTHFPGAKIAHLTLNYRCTPEILSVAEKLINVNTNRHKVSLNAHRHTGDSVTYDEYDQPEDEAEGIADYIGTHRYNGRDYKDMAILCRTNSLTRSFEECFRRKSVPYVLIGTFGFYDRKEVKNSIAFMKFLANREDAISFEEIINVPSRGVGPSTLIKLLEHAQENDVSFPEACRQSDSIKGVRKKTVSCLQHFMQVLDKFDNNNPYETLVDIFEDSGFLDYLRHTDRTKNEYREGNVLEFLRGFYNYCKRTAAPSIDQYLQEIMLMSASDKETSDDAVKIMTIHAAKGLEFDIVFVPGLEEDTFPHKRSVMDNSVQEERRVCYVATTRAKDHLHLTRSKTRITDSTPLGTVPSRFLVDMKLVEQLF